MANVKIPNIYIASELLPDGSANPVIDLVEMATRFQISLKVLDADNREYQGVKDYRFLPYATAKNLLLVPGISITNYPLYVSCAASKLDENTPDVLPGYEITEIDSKGVEITTPVKLSDWLAARNYTTQDLIGGLKGFGLPEVVSFADGVALDALAGFTVMDQPTYKALLSIGNI